MHAKSTARCLFMKEAKLCHLPAFLHTAIEQFIDTDINRLAKASAPPGMFSTSTTEPWNVRGFGQETLANHDFKANFGDNWATFIVTIDTDLAIFPCFRGWKMNHNSSSSWFPANEETRPKQGSLTETFLCLPLLHLVTSMHHTLYGDVHWVHRTPHPSFQKFCSAFFGKFLGD
jgi:hypothetical protein